MIYSGLFPVVKVTFWAHNTPVGRVGKSEGRDVARNRGNEERGWLVTED